MSDVVMASSMSSMLTGGGSLPSSVPPPIAKVRRRKYEIHDMEFGYRSDLIQHAKFTWPSDEPASPPSHRNRFYKLTCSEENEKETRQ